MELSAVTNWMVLLLFSPKAALFMFKKKESRESIGVTTKQFSTSVHFKRALAQRRQLSGLRSHTASSLRDRAADFWCFCDILYFSWDTESLHGEKHYSEIQTFVEVFFFCRLVNLWPSLRLSKTTPATSLTGCQLENVPLCNIYFSTFLSSHHKFFDSCCYCQTQSDNRFLKIKKSSKHINYFEHLMFSVFYCEQNWVYEMCKSLCSVFIYTASQLLWRWIIKITPGKWKMPSVKMIKENRVSSKYNNITS